MEEVNLNPAAISSLTSRIKADLKPSKVQRQSGKPQKNNGRENKSAKSGSSSGKKNAVGVEQQAKQVNRKTKDGHRAQNSAKVNGGDFKGKKRSRDGKVKEISSTPDPKISKLALREEVLALGGTEEDLNLIDELDSGSEVEGVDRKGDKTLDKEVQKLIKELGLTKAAAKYQAEQADEDEGMDMEEDESNPNKIEVSQNSRRTDKPMQSGQAMSFEPTSEWHSANLPSISMSGLHDSVPDDAVERLRDYAKDLLQTEGEAYGVMNKSSSSAHQFYSTIMSSGTLTDKISALTLSVQESPLHNQRALDTLVGLAKKRSRGQAIEVLTALKDLLGPGSLLPASRKLRTFATQPGLFAVKTKALENWTPEKPLPAPLTKSHLLSWVFEDILKSMFFEILKVVETWCNDEVVYARTKAVDIVFELLRDKPEQEANLLRLLVNKLGDTEKKIASRASYSLLQLQIPHPLMKPTIISAIEENIIFKPGQSLHAKYYAIITLNQTVLSSKEDSVVRKILDIYFGLFVVLLKPEPTQQEAEKLTVNKKGQRQGGGGKPGKMAMKKQKAQQAGTSPDEQLREKMMSAVLTGINRAIPYTDVNDKFFAKHLDTLFKITHSSNFNTSIQALMLIQQLCGSHQAASDRFYRTLYESLLDPRLLTTSKQILYLNLLYRALRADLNVKRVKAFAKRLLQVIAMHQPSFACAVLYLLRELESVFPTLALYIDEPEQGADDEEEHYRDVPEEGANGTIEEISTDSPLPKDRYDGRKRAPEYSHADKSCLWELSPFISHYHPSVALFAQRLLSHESMPPKPTLDSHTLIKFLDRFVYKNPKKSTGKMHGSSIMQPLAGGDTSSLLVSSSGTGYKPPVNSDAFYKKAADKVDAEDAFFHKYFGAKAEGKESADKKKEKKRKKAEEGGSEDEDEDEAEIWQALVDSHPEIEGPEDSDMDMSDLGELAEEMSDMDSDADDLDGDELDNSQAGGVLLGDEEMENDEEDEDGSVIQPDEQASEGESEGLDFEDEEGALLGSDDEVPSDLDEAFAKELEYASKPKGKAAQEAKAGEGGKEKKGDKRRRLKNLPMFASAEDYAALLGDDDGNL